MVNIQRLLKIIKLVSSLAAAPLYYVYLYWKTRQPLHPVLRLIHNYFTLKHLLRERFTPKYDTRQLSAEYKAFEDLLRSRPVYPLDKEAAPGIEALKLRKRFGMQPIIPKSHLVEVVYDESISRDAEQALPRLTDEQIVVKDSELGHEVKVYWVYHTKHTTLESWKTQPFIYYLHGGAYMLGDIDSYSGFEGELSKRTGMPVLHLEYSLIPEIPLPRCVHQAVEVYKVLLSRDSSVHKRMTVMGDSAGGGLTLLFLQSIIQQGLPTPALAVPLSPWADLASSGESWTKNVSKDVMLKHDRVEWGMQQCFGGKHHFKSKSVDPAHPDYSPVNGSFAKFPPTLILAGTAELLESDARAVCEKCNKAGVDVELVIAEHMCHVYPLFYRFYPEAEVAFAQIIQWIQRKMKTNVSGKPADVDVNDV